MTKKDFLFALRRGLGRGILAVKEKSEKFRRLVLENCGKCLAFDPQSEGTRSWYTYQLISCYEDKETFIKPVAEKLLRKRSDGGWEVAYLSELLTFFADEGSVLAKEALSEKYARLYRVLLERQRRPRGYVAAIDDFEKLCVSLSYDFEAYHRIAKDVGTLYLRNSFYHGDFGWLYAVNERKYNARLKKEAKTSPEIQRYIEIEEGEKKRFRASLRANRQKPLPETKGFMLSFRLLREPASTVEEYADRYLNETDDEKRAEALRAFCRCPFPFAPTPVIKDAKSESEELKNAAFQALANIRHPAVREFAWQKMNSEPKIAFPLLVKNYRSEDEEWLYNFVKRLPIDYDNESGWHNYHFAIREAFDDGVKGLPKRLLHLMYEQTLCSMCREFTLKLMGKRRMLSKELLTECLYDSNDEVREYARKKLDITDR